ncbi:DUF1800 family protein [Hyphomonas sp.]|uniref:DUF1800 domain-containing protein n=1 Tax=Hyphomonas sp. TaxID=87 RepID=UPI0025C6E2AF|nr:DUF1800 family protein [Hyphomonas sp.]
MPDSLAAAIAVNRFGLGARQGELEAAAPDPKAWLSRQLKDNSVFVLSAPGLPTTRVAAEALGSYLEDLKTKTAGNAGKMTPEAQEAAILKPLQQLRDINMNEIEARTLHGLTTGNSFAERLVLFWSNHFTVSANKAVTIPFAGVFEREVIRAGMTGTFADLLVAATRHPGMLLYLDQAQSMGPNSKTGKRRDKGLNENLAREILELQTLGAQGGYTQSDVTEFAKALTGWSLAGGRTKVLVPGAVPGDFIFIDRFHEPGVRTVMGKRYAETGEEQGEAILRDLAIHPSTAQRIATKLARHFISDDPPAAAVEALAKRFRNSGGRLPALHETLISLEAAWQPEARKFKSPNEFFLSALRLVGLPKIERKGIVAGYGLLGQVPFQAPSPEGWPDDAVSWAGPDAVIKRVEWAQGLSDRMGSKIRPETLVRGGLGPALSVQTVQSMARAESASQGLTLGLMSPEFQRR